MKIREILHELFEIRTLLDYDLRKAKQKVTNLRNKIINDNFEVKELE